MHIAIFLPNWIGDVVMATPALRAIRRHFGDAAKITGVMKPYVARVLEGSPWLDNIVLYDRQSKKSEQRFFPVARQLKAEPIDIAAMFPNSLSSAALAWWGGSKQRIGFSRYGRSCLLTKSLHAPQENWLGYTPRSAVVHYLEVAYAMGCPPESTHLELATRHQDEVGAEQVWNNLGFHDGRPVVVLNTGGARGAAKHWPAEYSAHLAQRLADDRGYSVLVLCGPAEKETAEQIAHLADHPHVKSMADQDLSIGVSKAVIRRSHLMVSTDSGPRHLAAAFGVPTVALFGPIDPRWSINYNPHELHLYEDLPCRPCGERACPLIHHRCMRDLTVDKVLAAAKRLMRSSEQTRAA